MSERRERLRARRLQLLAQSELLRNDIAYLSQAYERPLAVVDRVLGGLRWLRANPVWPLGMAAGFVLMRPARLLRLAARGWAVWRLWRRFGPTLRPYLGPAVHAWRSRRPPARVAPPG